MEKQELQAVQELYNLVHQWQEKYTVGWVDKRFYRGVKHLVKSLQVLTNTEYLPCKTIEEKVANAAFYVSDGVIYRIENSQIYDGCFCVVNEDNGEMHDILLSNLSADDYFLGTVRL